MLAAFNKVNLGGLSDFASAVQIAQLALKHRKNKNGGQRIIVFVGSPLKEEVAALKQIGKQLKKNNVAVDVISMGEIDENHDKLLEFINVTNSNDNWYKILIERRRRIVLCLFLLSFFLFNAFICSHLITVPAGVQPGDALQSSSLLESGRGGHGGGGSGGGNDISGGGGFEDYGGIDPSMDPELAMAIRVSTEEARQREEAKAKSEGAKVRTLFIEKPLALLSAI